MALRMICGLTQRGDRPGSSVAGGEDRQRIVARERTLSESGLAYETPTGGAVRSGLSRCWRWSTSF